MKRVSSVAVLGLMALVSASAMAAGPATRPAREKVLILPFEAININNGDPTLASIVRGLRQSLVSDIGRAKLFLASAPQDAQPAPDLESALKAGAAAGARYVLYGTFEVVQNDIRATGHLVDVSTEQEVTPMRATGSIRDLFAIEDALGDQATRTLPGPKTVMREAMLPRDTQQQQQPAPDQQQAQAPAMQQPDYTYPYPPYYDAGYDQPYYYPYYYPYTYIRYPGRHHHPVEEPPVNNNYQVPANPFGIDYNAPRNQPRDNTSNTPTTPTPAPTPSPTPAPAPAPVGRSPISSPTPHIQPGPIPGMSPRESVGPQQGSDGTTGSSTGSRTGGVDVRSR